MSEFVFCYMQDSSCKHYQYSLRRVLNFVLWGMHTSLSKSMSQWIPYGFQLGFFQWYRYIMIMIMFQLIARLQWHSCTLRLTRYPIQILLQVQSWKDQANVSEVWLAIPVWLSRQLIYNRSIYIYIVMMPCFVEMSIWQSWDTALLKLTRYMTFLLRIESRGRLILSWTANSPGKAHRSPRSEPQSAGHVELQIPIRYDHSHYIYALLNIYTIYVI